MRELCRIRSDAYFCLSLGFDYPTSTLGTAPTATKIADTINSLPRIAGLEELDSAAKFFVEELARSSDASGTPLLHMQIEYNRLFAGPNKPQAYPCEQAFLNQSGWAVANTRELLLEYLQGGLRLAPGFKDSADHISLEFEFMSHLCEKELTEASGGNDSRQQQQSFLENHIVNWVPAFLATVERSAVLSFYKLLARIARVFVVWDYAHVEHLTRQSRKE